MWKSKSRFAKFRLYWTTNIGPATRRDWQSIIIRARTLNRRRGCSRSGIRQPASNLKAFQLLPSSSHPFLWIDQAAWIPACPYSLWFCLFNGYSGYPTLPSVIFRDRLYKPNKYPGLSQKNRQRCRFFWDMSFTGICHTPKTDHISCK